MNKKIVLDFEARFDQFKSKMKEAFEDVQKTNEKFLGKGPDTSNLSDLQRNRFEQERLNQAKEKFRSNYSEEERRGKLNPFSERGKEFYKQEEQFDKHDAVLKENSETIKRQNIEENVRHKEYRSLSDKELKQRAEELRNSSKKSLAGGDTNKAEAFQQEAQSVEAAKNWRDKVAGKGDDESNQTKFMRQTARNLFLNEMMGGGTQILGHGTNVIGQSAQTGFQGFSSAQASGMSTGGSLLAGGAMAAISGFMKLFSMGEDLEKAQNRVGGIVGSNSDFSKYGNIGIGGPQQIEEMLDKSKALARETGFGSNLENRTVEHYMLQRGMGLEGQDVRAFSQFERGGDNLGAGEGTLMLTKMLENLGVGVSLGDKEGTTKDLAKLPKYLEKLLMINEKTFQVTGELNKNAVKSNMAFLGGASSLGGIFAHEKNAADLMGGIQSTFSQPGDEFMKFQNIQAIRETKGSMSQLEIMKLSENMNDPEVVNKMFQNLKKSYGGTPQAGTQLEANFMSDVQKRFGMDSVTKAEQFAKQMEATGGMASPEMMEKFMKEGEGDPTKILANEAEKLTTSVEKLGSGLGNVIADLATSVRKLSETIAKWIGDDDADKKSNNKTIVHNAMKNILPDGLVKYKESGSTW